MRARRDFAQEFPKLELRHARRVELDALAAEESVELGKLVTGAGLSAGVA
jgi:hypothetical protein